MNSGRSIRFNLHVYFKKMGAKPKITLKYLWKFNLIQHKNNCWWDKIFNGPSFDGVGATWYTDFKWFRCGSKIYLLVQVPVWKMFSKTIIVFEIMSVWRITGHLIYCTACTFRPYYLILLYYYCAYVQINHNLGTTCGGRRGRHRATGGGGGGGGSASRTSTAPAPRTHYYYTTSEITHDGGGRVGHRSLSECRTFVCPDRFYLHL